MLPRLISGGKHADARGILSFNNDLDLTEVKRIYFIENQDTQVVRAWQGHKTEQRWFTAVKGSFKIELIAIDNWEKPSTKLEKYSFMLSAEQLNVLHIPSGYVNSIQSLETDSKLLVMANYLLGEHQDEYRYSVDYFG